MNALQKGELYMKKVNIPNQQDYMNTRFELIQEISNQIMNNKCFDCRKEIPKYISINNAIFLCEDCAEIHKTFPKNISFIIDNNLNLLSNTFLKYLYHGGNENLDNFINYDFPGLQNYSPEILYKTQAMIYYREDLKCKIEGKPKPVCPNNVMAYKLVSKNGLINIREENNFKTKKVVENKDVINNYYNNYNNTYNTYNNYNITNDGNYNIKRNSFNSFNSKSIKHCSLVSKAFFNEMKNLFGKKYINSDNDSKNNYEELSLLKSYNHINKMKNKFKHYSLVNEKNTNTLNQSLPTLNESFNYSLTNRANETLPTNRFLNKSAVSEHKSPNQHSFSKKFLNPKASSNKYRKKKTVINEHKQDIHQLKKKKLTIDVSEIGKHKDKNNLLNLNDKIYRQKKKIFNSFKIYKKPQNWDYDLSFELNKKYCLQKNNLLNKLNKQKKKCLIGDYINNINNKSNQINLKKNKKSENQTDYYYINNNSNLNTIDSKDNFIAGNCHNKEIGVIKVKKKKYLNISCDVMKRKPIKVNLNITSSKNIIDPYIDKKEVEIKKKALQDKKEQEQLEDEDIHNILFERKDNDLFNNIICMNNDNNNNNDN